MVDCCCDYPDFLVQPYRWLLGHFCRFKMRRSSTLLHRSRGTKHTHRYNHALSTSSNGMGATDVASPKDTGISDFIDWGIVSLAPKTFSMLDY